MAPGAGAGNEASANAEELRVLQLENAWNQAVQAKDSNALKLMLSEELVYVEYDGGVMNKEQYLASVRAPSAHKEHIVNESMHAHSHGSSVVVTGVYREEGIKTGKTYVLRERFVDTWIERNTMWVCVASQSTLILR